MAGKSNYRPTRDRRIPQGNSPGAPVGALWHIDLVAWEGVTGIAEFECVLWVGGDGDTVSINVWPDADYFSGQGFTAFDAEGEISPIFTRNDTPHSFTVSFPRSNGLTTLNIPERNPLMTSRNGIQCAGGVFRIPFEVFCNPNTKTYYASITGGGEPFVTPLEGSLNSGIFEDEPGWKLEWNEENKWWILIDPTLESQVNLASTRCDPTGTYDNTPFWSAVITAELPP